MPCSRCSTASTSAAFGRSGARRAAPPEPEPASEPAPRVEPAPATRADSEPEGRLLLRRRSWPLVAGGALLVAVLLVVGILVAVLPLGGGSGGSIVASGCDTSRGTLTVGMIAPLSGGLGILGLGMSHAAHLAVNQANQRCAVPGYRLVLQAEDDQATPQVAAEAATKLGSDPNVVGVVGTLNSSYGAGRAAGPGRSRHPAGLAGQHEPDPDPRRQPDHRAVAAVRELLPGGHHRSGSGPVRGAVPGAEGGQEEHRRDR